MRDDNNNRYEYNMDVSRTLAQRGAGSMAHMTSSLAQYPQDMPLLASGGMPTSYRGNGYPNVNTKGYYYSMGADLTDAYGADGSVDYGLSCSPYQVISSDPVQMPVASSYGTWPTTTRPKSTNQGAAGGGLYMDSESAYGAYGAAGSATSLVHRPAVSVAGDSSPYSFSGFAASLPSAGANSSTERLLPTPVSRAAAASNYRADGLPANTASCYASSNKSDHQSPTGVVGAPTGIQGSPTSPLSEVTGYASSAYGYAGARSSHHHQHQHHHHHHGGNSTADVYASVSNGGPETIFGDADRNAGTQGSAVDLSGYTYGAASPADSSSLRRASSGSGLTSRSTAESSSGSSVSYVSSGEGGPPSSLGQGATAAAAAAYHHSSSSSAAHGHLHQHHGHNHHHQHQHQHQQHHNHSQQQHHASAVHHHASPRHGSHHIAEQRIVAGSTAYGAGSTGSNGAGSGIGGSGVSGNTASAADSSHHRSSVSTRR